MSLSFESKLDRSLSEAFWDKQSRRKFMQRAGAAASAAKKFVTGDTSGMLKKAADFAGVGDLAGGSSKVNPISISDMSDHDLFGMPYVTDDLGRAISLSDVPDDWRERPGWSWRIPGDDKSLPTHRSNTGTGRNMGLLDIAGKLPYNRLVSLIRATHPNKIRSIEPGETPDTRIDILRGVGHRVRINDTSISSRIGEILVGLMYPHKDRIDDDDDDDYRKIIFSDHASAISQDDISKLFSLVSAAKEAGSLDIGTVISGVANGVGGYGGKTLNNFGKFLKPENRDMFIDLCNKVGLEIPQRALVTALKDIRNRDYLNFKRSQRDGEQYRSQQRKREKLSKNKTTKGKQIQKNRMLSRSGESGPLPHLEPRSITRRDRDFPYRDASSFNKAEAPMSFESRLDRSLSEAFWDRQSRRKFMQRAGAAASAAKKFVTGDTSGMLKKAADFAGVGGSSGVGDLAGGSSKINPISISDMSDHDLFGVPYVIDDLGRAISIHELPDGINARNMKEAHPGWRWRFPSNDTSLPTYGMSLLEIAGKLPFGKLVSVMKAGAGGKTELGRVSDSVDASISGKIGSMLADLANGGADQNKVSNLTSIISAAKEAGVLDIGTVLSNMAHSKGFLKFLKPENRSMLIGLCQKVGIEFPQRALTSVLKNRMRVDEFWAKQGKKNKLFNKSVDRKIAREKRGAKSKPGGAKSRINREFPYNLNFLHKYRDEELTKKAEAPMSFESKLDRSLNLMFETKSDSTTLMRYIDHIRENPNLDDVATVLKMIEKTHAGQNASGAIADYLGMLGPVIRELSPAEQEKAKVLIANLRTDSNTDISMKLAGKRGFRNATELEDFIEEAIGKYAASSITRIAKNNEELWLEVSENTKQRLLEALEAEQIGSGSMKDVFRQAIDNLG